MLNINGVNIEYQYDGAHDARPTEHTLHGLDGLNLSGLDWMRLSHVCRLMAARDRKPERAFVRVSGWTADRPNMRLIVDVLQDDDGTVSVPLPLTSDYLLVDSAECDDRCQYGWLSVLEQLPEHVDYGRLDETGMRVVDWLNGMADPSPEIFEDWEAIGLIRKWLKAQADSEWECAKDGLSDGYGGFDVYTRAIQHCQDMLMDDTAEHGKPDEGGKMNKQNETVLLEHLADTFETKLRETDRSIGTDIPDPYREGRMDAFGWAATYCRLLAERK